jgi:DNA-binding CsgD family transcriptional regulator
LFRLAVAEPAGKIVVDELRGCAPSTDCLSSPAPESVWSSGGSTGARTVEPAPPKGVSVDVVTSEARAVCPLTPCQAEAVRLLAAGQSVKEIAALLGRSPSTIYEHLDKARTQLGVRTEAELAVWAVRTGLV